MMQKGTKILAFLALSIGLAFVLLFRVEVQTARAERASFGRNAASCGDADPGSCGRGSMPLKVEAARSGRPSPIFFII